LQYGFSRRGTLFGCVTSLSAASVASDECVASKIKYRHARRNPLTLLTLNSGSSSIKFSLFAAESADDPTLLLDGELTGVGDPNPKLVVAQPGHAPEHSPAKDTPTLSAAIHLILDTIANSDLPTPNAVGYRIVHPGPKIDDHLLITNEVLKELEAASTFAPLHDPEALKIIHETMKRLPNIPHFACFDTIFHRTMPPEASTYAIPGQYRAQGAKRYGFHGLSCESIVHQLRPLAPLPHRMVIAHLGSGCSVTALLDGASIDTTMGLTPTGGIVMGTRTGDLDPGLLLYLLRQQKGSDPATTLETILNHRSGMVALTNLPNDMLAVRKAAAAGNAQAILALKIFTRSVRKAIGSYAWLLGGLDTIVFTGGIGEHDQATRSEILQDLTAMGIVLDSSRNQTHADGILPIHASDSKTAIYAVPAQEDLMIAMHVKRMASSNSR
jgi:acetate kinase